MSQPLLPINTVRLESIPADKRGLIKKHLALVLQANKQTNLTRITSFEEGLLLHVEDSLAGLPEIDKAPNGLYADLGTGAGFPGIPLAIASGRQTLLVDSVHKKTAILDSIVTELGIQGQVCTYTGRIEQLAREKREGFAVLTTRALASLASLIELASPLLPFSGQLICYKAKIDEAELGNAERLKEKVGMRLVSDRAFFLSDGQTTRRILVFEKYRHPATKLPRREGMAQKRPYSL